jgi:PhoPQ-activated pathogenicity-related protein
MAIFRPAEIKHPDKALLVITGGSTSDDGPPLESGEARIAQQIAQTTGSVTAVIAQVPNEPLFNGLTEDGIIAYTFEQFLNGEGDDWPLLLPMVKSAVRAMDTVQAVAKKEFQTDVAQFMVLGGSKRGWTTWLSAVADPRVAAIAPVVIDMLNMVPQSKNQLKSYGGFSVQVADYTQRKIQRRMQTPEGERLLAIVDPFSYRDKLTLPKLVVLGTNDPYWNVDSSSAYFPNLQGPKYLYYCANTGHDINPGGINAVTGLYKSLLTGQSMPRISWNHIGTGRLQVTWSDPAGRATLWKADSPMRDFRLSKWTSAPLEGSGFVNVSFETPKLGWAAYYVEVASPGPAGTTIGLCTTMTVLPNWFPFPDAIALLGKKLEDKKS